MDNRHLRQLGVHAEVYVDDNGVVREGFAFASYAGTIVKRVDLDSPERLSVDEAFRALARDASRLFERERADDKSDDNEKDGSEDSNA